MPDVVRVIRAAVEGFIPWFDREQTDRARADLNLELAKSRATRVAARDEIMRASFDRAGKRLGDR